MAKLFFPWKNICLKSGLRKELVIVSSTIYVKTCFSLLFYQLSSFSLRLSFGLEVLLPADQPSRLGSPFSPCRALNTHCLWQCPASHFHTSNSNCPSLPHTYTCYPRSIFDL